ncbi:MAG TPA: hypothetical protein PK323_09020 [Bacteroidia bacterium]|nr:hypothetical protein [Bacteroidia bacterium]
MNLNIKSILLFAGISFSLSACYYDSLEELHPAPIIIPGVNDSTSTGCDTTKVITYTNDIEPIFSNNCKNCHTGTGASGGIDLSTYDGSKAAANLLVDAVTWGDGIKNMPQGSPSKINECSIGKIKKWVESGTLQ